LNKNQSQPAVATRTTIENTIGTQALRMRNEYRGTVKPQRNPNLNLTGQRYWLPLYLRQDEEDCAKSPE
jgi:hypothetical protein